MNEIIGIDFGDNDFGNTVRPFMENIIANLDFVPTKAQVVSLFNETAYGLYLAFQNQFSYGSEAQAKHLKEKYLKITEKQVFIGKEEVEAYIEKMFHNGELYVYYGWNYNGFVVECY